MSAADQSAPPSYSESVQQGQGYPSYQPSYGAVGGAPPPGPFQAGPPGYLPPEGYDPKKQTGPYPPGPYPHQPAYPHQPVYPPPAGTVPGYGHPQGPQTNVIVHPTQNVVVVGGCPACRVGILEEDFTCLGVLCAIIFFPIGLLCCLLMRQRRCSHCGAVFG